MQALAYMLAWLLAVVLRALPLRIVAAVGRFGGGVAFRIDRRHRKAALLNLSLIFPEKTESERRVIALENFRRLGEGYATAVTITGMSDAALRGVVEVAGLDRIDCERGAIIAIGHFGNFEAYSRIGRSSAGCRFATTYRPLKQPALDRLVRKLREESGCLFYDRRREVHLLQQSLRERRLILGLLCDQHAGSRALRLPFLGHECSVNSAPAVFALRYDYPLYTAVCSRTAPAKWRITIGPEIATQIGGHKRTTAEIMADVHREFERAIVADPENWFWVHDRWRFLKGHRTAPRVLEKRAGRPASA